DIYNKYFSARTKRIISQKSFLDEYDTSRFQMTSITVGEPIKQADPINTFKIESTVKCMENGAPAEKKVVDYITKEKGNYKILYKGMLEMTKYNMTAPHSSNLIHSKDALIATTTDGMLVEITMLNSTNLAYQFGDGENGAKVTMTTADGKLIKNVENTQILEPDKQITLSLFLEEKVEIQKIMLSRIYTKTTDGKLVESGDGVTYSVTILAPPKAETKKAK
ncbi:MAG: hypothetical protein RR540_02680, partial [Oscillospiraceae bacterium]